jgi:hypothetical protein
VNYESRYGVAVAHVVRKVDSFGALNRSTDATALILCDLVRPCAVKASRPARKGGIEIGIEFTIGQVGDVWRRRENPARRQMRNPAIERLVGPMSRGNYLELSAAIRMSA